MKGKHGSSCAHQRARAAFTAQPRPASSVLVCWCCEPKSSHSHGNRIRCSGHANIAPKASPSSSLQGRRREAPVAARAGHQVTQIRPRGAQRNQKATATGQKKYKNKKINLLQDSQQCCFLHFQERCAHSSPCPAAEPGEGEEEIGTACTDYAGIRFPPLSVRF